MYRIGQTYKIQLSNSITYTAKILDQDALQIKILDRTDTEIIITKSEVRQSKLLGQNRTGVSNERQ